jgi:hypothetical protein
VTCTLPLESRWEGRDHGDDLQAAVGQHVGLNDLRSDKERTAGYTKQMRDDERKANK